MPWCIIRTRPPATTILTFLSLTCRMDQFLRKHVNHATTTIKQTKFERDLKPVSFFPKRSIWTSCIGMWAGEEHIPVVLAMGLCGRDWKYGLPCSAFPALISTHRHYEHSLQWRHNEDSCVSNRRRFDCLLNRLFRRRLNKANLRDLIAATGLVILLKLDLNHRFFSPCDLGIWWMTQKNTIGHLFYATLSFLHHFIAIGEYKTGVTVRKPLIWVNIDAFLSRVTLKFDGWPSKTIGHLFYATSSFRVRKRPIWVKFDTF